MSNWNSIADILKKIRRTNQAFSQRVEEAQAILGWEEAVGPHIARHARPTGMRGKGVLLVEVDLPVWRAELHHRKAQILEKLNANREKTAIQDLFFIEPRER